MQSQKEEIILYKGEFIRRTVHETVIGNQSLIIERLADRVSTNVHHIGTHPFTTMAYPGVHLLVGKDRIFAYIILKSLTVNWAYSPQLESHPYREPLPYVNIEDWQNILCPMFRSIPVADQISINRTLQIPEGMRVILGGCVSNNGDGYIMETPVIIGHDELDIFTFHLPNVYPTGMICMGTEYRDADQYGKSPTIAETVAKTAYSYSKTRNNSDLTTKESYQMFAFNYEKDIFPAFNLKTIQAMKKVTSLAYTYGLKLPATQN